MSRDDVRDGKPKAHAVNRYDALGRLAVDFYFAREREEPLSLYFKTVHTYDGAGNLLRHESRDRDGKVRVRVADYGCWTSDAPSK